MAGKVRRSADLIQRLESAAKAQAQGQPETLRGLLDESGVYDRVGGVDEVIRQAKQQGKSISKNPPETLVMGVSDPQPVYDDTGAYFGFGGVEEPVPYRSLFPSIDYRRAERPVPVSFEWHPRLNRMNSVYYPKTSNDTLLHYGHWSLYNEPYLSRDTVVELMKNPDLLQELSRGKQMRLPESGMDKRMRLELLDLAARRNLNPDTTPYSVIETNPRMSGYSSPGGDERDYMATVLHEVGHHAHLPALWTLFEEGGKRGAVPVTGAMTKRSQAPTMQTLPGMESVGGLITDMPYRMRPVEADQMLADIKRAYAEATGNLVTTQADADKALKWYSQRQDQDPRFIANAFHAVTYADPMQQMATFDPESFNAGNEINRKIFLQRMRELYGLGGAAVLGGLLDEQE